jgi:hypothetical protein
MFLEQSDEQCLPHAPKETVHQKHVLLDRSTAREAPRFASLLFQTALQCTCPFKVRLHEQISSSTARTVEFIILQRMHAQQLPAQEPKSSNDGATGHASASSTTASPTDSDDSSYSTNAAADCHSVQKLQGLRVEATANENSSATDSTAANGQCREQGS